MKLKNVAALGFRIAGAFAAIEGFAEVIAALPNVRSEAFEMGVGVLVVGCCCLYYSKKLGVLFCRGLEDRDV